MMIRYLTFFSCCLAMVLGSSATALGDGPIVVSEGNTEMVFGGGVNPGRLPVDRFAPAVMVFSIRVTSLDESFRPAMRRLLVETDRNLIFNLKDTPICRNVPNEGGITDSGGCSRALVGTGMINFDPTVRAQGPICCGGIVLVYNGGLVHGNRRLWLRYSTGIPNAGTFVDPLEFRRVREGPYRTRLVLPISKVVPGSLMNLQLSLKKGSFGTCPAGRIRLRATGIFADGSRLSGQLAQTCYPR